MAAKTRASWSRYPSFRVPHLPGKWNSIDKHMRVGTNPTGELIASGLPGSGPEKSQRGYEHTL